MMRFKRFDVVVTAFPYADDLLMKKRPAVCIASLRPFRNIELYWVLMITSTKLKGWQGDIAVTDLKRAGLPIPSIVRTAKIACVDASLIEKKVGILDTATKTAVQKTVQGLFS
ncbi:type II toxin-antitoxin system PemK/MazF family toxin [Candidatus Kaiserbacteria bacterium]|nr:type II toxin-antitoxin system PemK/MazF family toxin [Candidatus Kaiserbacteria bacterium]